MEINIEIIHINGQTDKYIHKGDVHTAQDKVTRICSVKLRILISEIDEQNIKDLTGN